MLWTLTDSTNYRMNFHRYSFDCVKPFCKKIRGVLFPYKDGLFIGTPPDPENLYDSIIKAFDDAEANMAAEEFENS